MGLSEKRIRIAWCSAAEGQKFQKAAMDFDKEIKELGPSPLRSKSDTPKKKEKK
jgi:coenzyme F420-reducing hydrogenase delta subunit